MEKKELKQQFNVTPRAGFGVTSYNVTISVHDLFIMGQLVEELGMLKAHITDESLKEPADKTISKAMTFFSNVVKKANLEEEASAFKLCE